MANAEMDKKLEKLWDEMTDIPFDEDEDGDLYLSRDYGPFYKGDSREEIWHWFDHRHSKGIHYLLYERVTGEKPTIHTLTIISYPAVDNKPPRNFYSTEDEPSFLEKAKAYFQKNASIEEAEGILSAEWNDELHRGEIVFPDFSKIFYICASASDLDAALKKDSF